jgi:hypothetical protein
LPQSVTPSYTASYPRRHCPNHHEFDAANWRSHLLTILATAWTTKCIIL